MNKLMKMKAAVSKTVGRKGLIVRKHSPEILLTVGVVGLVGATVMACKATTKAEFVIDTAKDKIDKVHEAL